MTEVGFHPKMLKYRIPEVYSMLIFIWLEKQKSN